MAGREKGGRGKDPLLIEVEGTRAEEQEELLEEKGRSGALREAEGRGHGGTGLISEDIPEEEDGTPDLGGHDEETGYGGDPDGDFTEPQEAFGPLDVRSAGGEDDLPDLPSHADILIVEERTAQGRTFRPYPGPVPWHRWTLNERAKGTKAYKEGERLMHYLRGRQRRLMEIAEVILERQCLYFEALFDGVDPEGAFLHLKPLTAVEVGKRLKMDHESVGRLAKSSFLQPDLPGAVPVSTNFFFRDTGRLGAREDVLVAHLRRLLSEQCARMTMDDIRKALEQKGVISASAGEKQIRSANERIRQVVRAHGMS